MFSTLRTRFGIPGIIATVALVFAMTGGAFAAKYLITSTKQISPSVLKKLKGAAGPAGAAGAQGPAGPNGATGAQGEKGAAGEKGANGTNGKSVVVAKEDPGTNCAEGGASVEVEGTPASKKYVCNGAEGIQGNKGEKGDPWTAGGTLPTNATETGTWAFSGTKESKYPLLGVFVSISFTIPLAAPLDEAHTVFVSAIGGNPDPTHCNGTTLDPKATSGYLCVYEGGQGGLTNPLIARPDFIETGAGVSGAVIDYTTVDTTSAPLAFGTWAVTG